MFVVIMISICKHTRGMNHSKDDESKYTLQSTRKNFTIAMTLAIVFGLGWAFGLTATSLPVEEITLVFQIIFCILVGAQGVLIFFLHGLRNKDFRGFWNKALRLIGHKTHLSYVFTSTKSSTVPECMQHGTDSTALATLPRKKDLSKNVYSEKSHTTTSMDSSYAGGFNVKANEAYGSLPGRHSQQPAEYEVPYSHIQVRNDN